VPIGSRVPTKNPNRWEVDPQPEPDQATWSKVSITVERSDGGIVDAEIIRPRSWILANGLCAGRMLPFDLAELEVSGLALVTAIDDCPPIAGGEGSVVTARFVTREVHVVASVDVLGADGTVETITGTTIHPVWSFDRQEWVPLAELADGETLQGLDGLAVVLSVTLSRVSQPVYNIEVHGEHVYQVGELGLVVHNVSRSGWGAFGWGTKLKAPVRGTIWDAPLKFRGLSNNALNKTIDGSQHVLLRNLFKGQGAAGLTRESLEAAAELSRRAILNTATSPAQVAVHQERLRLLLEALSKLP
jgi:hypothetical protein